MSFLKRVDGVFAGVVNGLHRRLFGHEPDAATMPFIYNTLWSVIGGGAAAVILLATNILAGRLLGPTEYGKIALISTIAQISIVFILFGMDRASMRLIAMQEKSREQGAHISTTFYFTLIMSGAFLPLAFIAHPLLARGIRVENMLVMVGFVYGIILAFRQLMDGFIRGLERFKLQSVVRMIEATLILLTFYLLWKLIPSKNYTIYALTLIGVGSLVIGFYVYHVRSYFTHFNKQHFHDQFSFGSLYFVAAIFGAVFGSLDKFLIGKYLSLHDLGIYSAYYAASVGILAQMNTLLFNVFFPTVAKNLRYLPSIVRKIDKLTVVGFLPLLALTLVLNYIIIHLFGSSYEFSLRYALSFSLLGVLIMIFSINASLVQAYSRKSFKQLFYMGNIANLFFIGVYVLIINFIGLSLFWIISVLICSYTVSIILCKYALYRGGGYGPGSSNVMGMSEIHETDQRVSIND
jgi:O-antigen/teichoic acid export membrane protein